MMIEYWIVKENKTGRIIANCGDLSDAIMMVSFDPNNRSYSKHRFILDRVIDVVSTTDKQLPGQIGLPSGKGEKLNSYTEKLPNRMEEPFIP